MKITETQLQDAIIEQATLQGWLVYHTHDSRHSAAGFPDLVLVRGVRLIFAELKDDKRKTTPEQDVWLAALQQVEHAKTTPEVYLWRPPDLDKVIPNTLRKERHG